MATNHREERFHRCGKNVTKNKKTTNKKVTTGYINELDWWLLYNEYSYQIIKLYILNIWFLTVKYFSLKKNQEKSWGDRNPEPIYYAF